MPEEPSPIKSVLEEAELWRSRCQELESSLCQANTDLEIANFRAKKTRELEDKMEIILKHNAQLLGENDSVNKTSNQRKTEGEIWKHKYEQQM